MHQKFEKAKPELQEDMAQIAARIQNLKAKLTTLSQR